MRHAGAGVIARGGLLGAIGSRARGLANVSFMAIVAGWIVVDAVRRPGEYNMIGADVLLYAGFTAVAVAAGYVGSRCRELLTSRGDATGQ